MGLIGLNKAFRIKSGPNGVELIPIYNTDKVMLADLVGYESQKAQLWGNTEAFLAGRIAFPHIVDVVGETLAAIDATAEPRDIADVLEVEGRARALSTELADKLAR